MSTFGVSRSQESIFDELLRPSVSSTSTTTTTSTNASLSSHHNASPVFSTKVQQDDKTGVRASPQPVTSLTAEKSGRLRLGKRPLAGVVISSGPGGHFETYEGTNERSSSCRKEPRPKTSVVKSKPTSLLRVNNCLPDTTTATNTCNLDTKASSATATADLTTYNQAPHSFEYPVDNLQICQNFELNHQVDFPIPELTSEDLSQLFSPAPHMQPENPSPDTQGPSSMHELGFSLMQSCETTTLFEEPPEIGAFVETYWFGGQGKYFTIVSSSGGPVRERSVTPGAP